MSSPNPQNLRPVVVTPTYNNQGTLPDILSRIAALGLPLIVVNDGCTDSTAKLLDQWRANHPHAQLNVQVHSRNRGKAAALQTGFAAAIKEGFTHAITVDTDGQHDPEEIPVLLAQAEQNSQAYVLGYRDDTDPDYPARSRVGRRISNFFIRIESGLRVRDSQCGMRVYPLHLVRTVRCRAGHFGYEAEIITRAVWSGCPVVEVPIVTRYLPAGQRVSHLRPWLDTLRGIGMHVRLVMRALAPWPHPRYCVDSKPSKRGEPLRRALWKWINPILAWRELRRGTLSRTEISSALAVGVFIGNLPAYGVQTLIGLYAARRLHLHPVAVVMGSHVSIPPVAPFLAAAAIACGHLLLHGTFPQWSVITSMRESWSSLAGMFLLDWFLGSVIVGGVLALVTFVVSQAILPFAINRDPRSPSACGFTDRSRRPPLSSSPVHSSE